MPTVEQAFLSLQAGVNAAHVAAHPLLVAYCDARDYLLIHRTKSLESLREKLETGQYSSIANVDDLLAYSIIIDTSPQERNALAFLNSTFDVVRTKKGKTISDERMFGFDCTRVYCRLLPSSDPTATVSKTIFEVQIRTILQHAWSKITHELVYKPQRLDPQASRLSAEVMAQIESIDRTFARFKTSKQGVKRVVRKEIVELDKILDMLEALFADTVVPSELRPSSGRRLAESIRGLTKQGKVEDAISAIDGFLRSLTPFPTSVTVYQLCLVALVNSNLLRSSSPYLLVTDELTSLYPLMQMLNKRVELNTA